MYTTAQDEPKIATQHGDPSTGNEGAERDLPGLYEVGGAPLPWPSSSIKTVQFNYSITLTLEPLHYMYIILTHLHNCIL